MNHISDESAKVVVTTVTSQQAAGASTAHAAQLTDGTRLTSRTTGDERGRVRFLGVGSDVNASGWIDQESTIKNDVDFTGQNEDFPQI